MRTNSVVSCFLWKGASNRHRHERELEVRRNDEGSDWGGCREMASMPLLSDLPPSLPATQLMKPWLVVIP